MERINATLEILARLVGFDTSSHLSNRDLIDWVRHYLARCGVQSEIFADATGDKFNLIATIGDNSQSGIVLSGHTDVVPADLQRWTSDPLTLRLDAQKAYGRGTTDMKGFLSIVLAAVPDMVKRKLNCPITLAFSYDEEVGCLGAPDLVARLHPGQRVIVGEPTNLHPGVQHKGGRVQSVRIAGVAAHSGTPSKGVNAIVHAASALECLLQLERDFARKDQTFPSTLAVSRIEGGGAINVVPSECRFTFMLRAVSKDDLAYADETLATCIAELDRTLKAQNAKAGAALETSCDVPPFKRGTLDPAYARLTNGRGAIRLNFGTEAGIFSDAGHDVIVCGPGDMAQGHIDDEFIAVQSLNEGSQFIEDVIHEACL